MKQVVSVHFQAYNELWESFSLAGLAFIYEQSHLQADNALLDKVFNAFNLKKKKKISADLPTKVWTLSTKPRYQKHQIWLIFQINAMNDETRIFQYDDICLIIVTVMRKQTSYYEQTTNGCALE